MLNQSVLFGVWVMAVVSEAQVSRKDPQEKAKIEHGLDKAQVPLKREVKADLNKACVPAPAAAEEAKQKDLPASDPIKPVAAGLSVGGVGAARGIPPVEPIPPMAPVQGQPPYVKPHAPVPWADTRIPASSAQPQAAVPKGADELDELLKQLGSALKKIGSGVKIGAGKFMTALDDGMYHGINALGAGLKKALPYAGKGLRVLGRAAGPVYAVYEAAKEIITDPNRIRGAIKGICAGGGGLLGGFLGGLVVGAAAGSFVPVIGNTVGGIVGGIVGAIGGTEFGRAAGQFIYDKRNEIKDTAAKAYTAVKDTAAHAKDALVSGAKQAVSAVGTGVANAATKAAGWIKSWF